MGGDDRVFPSIDGLLAQAAQALERGELDKAFELYGGVASERPDRWEGHLGLAHVYFRRDDPLAALRVLPGALEADATCMPAYHMLAVLGVNGGVVDTAIDHLERGAREMPTQAMLFEWLVPLYAQAGRDHDLRQCMLHYARLRGLTVRDVALVFARNPNMPEDIRSRITVAAGFS